MLLAHYDRHARILPWRTLPSAGKQRNGDAYRVWLSEIMLQQTTVTAVIPYYERFTARWENVAALAGADEAEVMAAWAGLGYYSRARNLVKCARMVAGEHDGQFPSSEAELLKLPGIGPYTAAAISAFAFGQRAVVVDANIERVVARLFAIGTPLPAGKADIRVAMDRITPTRRAGDFAQAMMDLGASVCSVRKPDCPGCPLNSHCKANQKDIAEAYPVKPAKKARPMRKGQAYWIERGGDVWLVRRPAQGMLGGMRALPDDGWSAGKDGNAKAPLTADWCVADKHVDHVFTHFALSLSIAGANGEIDEAQLPTGEWWPLKRLDKAGLPTLFMKAVRVMTGEEDNSQ